MSGIRTNSYYFGPGVVNVEELIDKRDDKQEALNKKPEVGSMLFNALDGRIYIPTRGA